MVEILYYSHNQLDGTEVNNWCRETILAANLPIISVTQKPTDFGKNILFERRGKSHSFLYRQILIGLEASEAEYLFFCEHDVLYHPSHFEFRPPRDDVYFYNNNVYKYRLADRKIITYDCGWLSQLCASRELLLRHYKKRLDLIKAGHRAYGYEPGSGQSKKIDNVGFERWNSQFPNIDIRHGGNWTGVNRMNPDEFKNKDNCRNWRELTVGELPGWDAERLLKLCC